MAEELKLFSVTLNWGAPGSDEGDYANWTWATDADAAIRQIAEEMADSGEKEFDTEADRAAYIEEVIANAGSYAVTKVNARLGPEVELLMKGPKGEWSTQAGRDFDKVKQILAKYGVGA